MYPSTRGHGDPAIHQSYDNKIGRTDEAAKRILFEMAYPTATHNDIQVNYNYATFHMYFPYVLSIYFFLYLSGCSSLNAELTNHDRPLNKRGKRDAAATIKISLE